MKSTYYLDTLPRLVEKYRVVVEQCLSIIEQPIDSSISDDRLHNVLKAKRMASEDAKYYAQQIDILENELSGVVVVDKPSDIPPLKRYTKK